MHARSPEDPDPDRPAPAMKDLLDARERIAPHLARTPVREYPSLSRLVGTTVVVKHENHLPTGAFKVRGGVNLLARMPASERARGIVCASTGNHGQSLAFASRLFGARTIVCVPQLANAAKLRAIEDLGGEIVRHGRDFDEAREHCEAIAAREGHRYVHSGNEPIAEITCRWIARKMLEHVGLPAEVPPRWPARGPPESAASAWIDEEQRWRDDEGGATVAEAE